MPSINFTGDTINGINFGGDQIQEVTMDGNVVWSGQAGMFADADSYTTDDTPQAVNEDPSTGDMLNLIHDNTASSNGLTFNYSGSTRTFNLDVTRDYLSGTGSTQEDRHWTFLKLFDSNDAEIINVGHQYGTADFIVYDCNVASPNWDDYNNSGNYHKTNISTSGTNNIEIRWNGSAWVVDINNGSYTYTNSNYNNSAAKAMVGIDRVGGNQNSLSMDWHAVDTT